ncbi:MAG: TonB family protein [bacterium]
MPVAQVAPEPRRQIPVRPTLRGEVRREPPLISEAAGFRRPAAPRIRPNRPASPAEEVVARPNPPEPEEVLVYPETHPDYAALVSSVRGRIDGAKRYPRLARRAGFEGRALLKFKILPDGRVADIRVLETSEFEILDKAAMRAVERAGPFQEEGRQIRGDYIEVILPVVFQLR